MEKLGLQMDEGCVEQWAETWLLALWVGLGGATPSPGAPVAALGPQPQTVTETQRLDGHGQEICRRGQGQLPWSLEGWVGSESVSGWVGEERASYLGSECFL